MSPLEFEETSTVSKTRFTQVPVDAPETGPTTSGDVVRGLGATHWVSWSVPGLLQQHQVGRPAGGQALTSGCSRDALPDRPAR